MSEANDIKPPTNEGGVTATGGSPGMSTDIAALRAANWEKLEWDVHERITALHAIVLRMEPSPVNDKIARELVAPAVALLAEFCTRVELWPDEDDLSATEGIATETSENAQGQARREATLPAPPCSPS